MITAVVAVAVVIIIAHQPAILVLTVGSAVIIVSMIITERDCAKGEGGSTDEPDTS